MTDLKQIGKYKVVNQIGRGSFGVVYKVYDPHLDDIFALKTLEPIPELVNSIGIRELRKRFFREARLIYKLQHKNIVRIYSVDEYEGIPYYLMEYIPQNLGSLAVSKYKLFPSYFPFPSKIVYGILLQLLEALTVLHKNKVIHRDIKPGNILIKGNIVKLADFGIARSPESTKLTVIGSGMGTPVYMSPEQERGYDVDERSDIYATGVLTYWMLVGKLPKGIVKAPSEIIGANKAWDKIIFKAMEDNLQKRYRDAREMLRALKTNIKESENIYQEMEKFFKEEDEEKDDAEVTSLVGDKLKSAILEDNTKSVVLSTIEPSEKSDVSVKTSIVPEFQYQMEESKDIYSPEKIEAQEKIWDKEKKIFLEYEEPSGVKILKVTKPNLTGWIITIIILISLGVGGVLFFSHLKRKQERESYYHELKSASEEYIIAAKRYNNHKYLEDALRVVNEILDKYPENKYAYDKLNIVVKQYLKWSESKISEGDYDEAIDLINKAISVNPGDPFLKEGHEKAKELLEKALKDKETHKEKAERSMPGFSDSIIISSDPYGADIYINGKKQKGKEKTPDSFRFKLNQEYDIEVILEGYFPARKNFNIKEPDEIKIINFDLKKIPRE